MNVLFWVLQVALAWLSIAGGVYQIFKFDDLRKGVAAMQHLPRGFWAILGAVGCIAGVGLILPAAFGVFPIVTPISAGVLAVQSLLISALYVKFGDKSPLGYSAFMTLLAAFIAYARIVSSPM